MDLGSAEGSVILFNELPSANVQWKQKNLLRKEMQKNNNN